ncbi:nickel pincer cofactor biosynthesis protein LarC [Leptolyngbya sp. FACHB-36]|uniref:nickel pincer cofactor biosynthesis protein LarC n=1 Tax=Leptolyngbya sp. FACHB-36 TaxID=2692808 RepID=UPI001680706F|nr:nickel pincer cofactor biosynthesis protein LarC [Leptolyngbya sp. FACHB-36]MBD2022678.1 nickel pincer cofactor biosynthesis protein LarC [Leptolyngbya sp. FACHB-36]
MKIAYVECPTGIAGDMCLGAIVDAGMPLDYLIEALSKLGIAEEVQLRAESVHRNGQRATKLHVDLTHESKSPTQAIASVEDHSHSHSATNSSARSDHHSHSHAHSAAHGAAADGHSHPRLRHLPEIEQMIRSAKLPARAEQWSLAVLRKLADAEGAVHGIPPEQVHFHEVGATDAIVDIVGTCLGLDWLDIEAIYCSALPTGGGTIRAAHGRLPVPAPAVLKLWELRQVPIYSNGIERELVTPTGAAIVTALAEQFGPPPTMTLHRVGLGAGTLELPLPNILRLWIGETERKEVSREKARSEDGGKETISLLETQIDDVSPQAIGYVFEALFAAGALDVFTQAIGMKKCRPGTLLSVVCRPDEAAACEAVLFRETTTLGIRRSLQQRSTLHREIQTIATPYGAVRVKVAWQPHSDQPTNVQPEYEDCAQIARQQNLPWREVHRSALHTWYEQSDAKYSGSGR